MSSPALFYKCCLLTEAISLAEQYSTICTDYSENFPFMKFDFSECPPAQWSNWDSSGCSVTCGSGTQSRNRTCNNQFFYGESCIGNDNDVIPCTQNPCNEHDTCESAGGVCQHKRRACRTQILPDKTCRRCHQCCKMQ